MPDTKPQLPPAVHRTARHRSVPIQGCRHTAAILRETIAAGEISGYTAIAGEPQGRTIGILECGQHLVEVIIGHRLFQPLCIQPVLTDYWFIVRQGSAVIEAVDSTDETLCPSAGAEAEASGVLFPPPQPARAVVSSVPVSSSAAILFFTVLPPHSAINRSYTVW